MFDMVIYMEADEVFVEMAAINADEVNTAVRVGYGLLDLVSDVAVVVAMIIKVILHDSEAERVLGLSLVICDVGDCMADKDLKALHYFIAIDFP